MPRVLIICYDFPGIYAAGVIRIYQFARSLPKYGWQPILLTAQPCTPGQTESIEASDGCLDCPKVTVVPPRLLVPSQVDHRAEKGSLLDAAPKENGGVKRLMRLATRLAVPDGKIGWIQPALMQGLEVAAKYSIEACLSTSPRPSSHFVAQRLARRLCIPWVADFSLPWSDAYWLSDRPSLIRWLDERLERSIVRTADHVTVAYKDLARSIHTRFADTGSNKISVIPTGFQDDLFRQEKPGHSSRFTIVYPGNHFCEKGRNGQGFLRSVDEWVSVEPRLKDEVRVVFIGKRDDGLLRDRAAMAHPEVVRVERLTSHRDCVRAILSSDVCVVNTVGNRIPGKVFECMRADKWVLALASRGSDLEKLMRSYPKAISVPPTDTSAIRNALQVLRGCTRSRDGVTGDGQSQVLEYSAERGAARLAHIFDDLLLSSRRSLEGMGVS